MPLLEQLEGYGSQLHQRVQQVQRNLRRQSNRFFQRQLPRAIDDCLGRNGERNSHHWSTSSSELTSCRRDSSKIPCCYVGRN
jgi:hypothetical protein